MPDPIQQIVERLTRLGFSLYEGRRAVRWVYVAARCARCGVLGCYAEWKVGYEPSIQLIDQLPQCR